MGDVAGTIGAVSRKTMTHTIVEKEEKMNAKNKLTVDVDLEALVALLGPQAKENPLLAIRDALELAATMDKFKANGRYFVLDTRKQQVIRVESAEHERKQHLDHGAKLALAIHGNR